MVLHNSEDELRTEEDEQGTEIVLGRNVLNRLRVLVDGPSGFTEIRV